MSSMPEGRPTPPSNGSIHNNGSNYSSTGVPFDISFDIIERDTRNSPKKAIALQVL